jgi:hypothetical protein
MLSVSDSEKKEIAKLLASKFIARSDVRAIQRSNGDYNPEDEKFSMASLLDHINGAHTYGHYLLNKDNECKLFVFDIDLNKPDKRFPDEKFWLPTRITDMVPENYVESNPRELWLDRTATVQRDFMKVQLRMMANMLARGIHNILNIPVAATYTGSKGVHVYGFTGLLPAVEVREAANLVLENLDCFEVYRGNNFYRHKQVADTLGRIDFEESYNSLTLEVFPKQITLENKGYGNLCRLPLGRNLKNPKDPTFFLDFRSNFGEKAFTPRDAIEALTVTDYWA